MPQRPKRLIGNTYQSWKVSRRYPLRGGGGGGGILNKVVYREAQSREVQPVTLLCAVFERRRYPFRAEPVRIGHYRKYPLPKKNEKLSTGSSPPFRPLNVFIHSEVKKNPWNVSVSVHFSRTYFYAHANTRKRKRTTVQINIYVNVDKSGRT